MTSQPTLLHISNDLMASGQIEGQARMAGFRVVTKGSTAKALEHVSETPVQAIVMELGDRPGEVAMLVATGIPVLVYASHIRDAELQAAQQAGAIAMSRGQAASRLREWLLQLPAG